MFMTRSTVLILQYDLPNCLLVSWNSTNLFGYTKYLNLNLNLVSSMMFPINLVYSRCPIFDTKLKTSLPVIWLKHWLWKNPGRSVSTNNEQLILIPGWSGRWWRLKRSSTNWSFFSKWSWNWLRIFVLKRIDFSSTVVSRLLAFGSVILCFSSINWSRLLS